MGILLWTTHILLPWRRYKKEKEIKGGKQYKAHKDRPINRNLSFSANHYAVFVCSATILANFSEKLESVFGFHFRRTSIHRISVEPQVWKELVAEATRMCTDTRLVAQPRVKRKTFRGCVRKCPGFTFCSLGKDCEFCIKKLSTIGVLYLPPLPIKGT